jgi:hypothetical protein
VVDELAEIGVAGRHQPVLVFFLGCIDVVVGRGFAFLVDAIVELVRDHQRAQVLQHELDRSGVLVVGRCKCRRQPAKHAPELAGLDGRLCSAFQTAQRSAAMCHKANSPVDEAPSEIAHRAGDIERATASRAEGANVVPGRCARQRD